MQRLCIATVAPEPWKNGGGLTRTLASHALPGAEHFAWRVSIAEISASGPFSVFAGVDRIATVLCNGPLQLSRSTTPGQVLPVLHEARQFEPLAFDGALALAGSIGAAPVSCLNVMTRRGEAQARVDILHAGTMIRCEDILLLYSHEAGWSVQGQPMQAGEAVLSQQPGELDVTRDGTVHAPLVAVHIQCPCHMMNGNMQ